MTKGSALGVNLSSLKKITRSHFLNGYHVDVKVKSIIFFQDFSYFTTMPKPCGFYHELGAIDIMLRK